jgi:hypothetical protein
MEESSAYQVENNRKLTEIENSITKSLLYDNTNEINTCKCSFKLALIITGIILGFFLITIVL